MDGKQLFLSNSTEWFGTQHTLHSQVVIFEPVGIGCGNKIVIKVTQLTKLTSQFRVFGSYPSVKTQQQVERRQDWTVNLIMTILTNCYFRGIYTFKTSILF